MKLTPFLPALSIVLALCAPAYSQTDNRIPKCALPCQEAVERVTTCRKDDYKCICQRENFEKIATASAPCVYRRCGISVTLSELVPAMNKICEAQK
ncbi:hypothetical protein GX51_02169 [Blastomyces parvus]|uniref:CFEM domain-containing protein n=1 Tax=Blastomyces parvus TaxID=2060905 RepID=A0A2B7XDJ7_9EURO|nr:hypothetical protein GX51_02169 [Blastomyces parvus]